MVLSLFPKEGDKLRFKRLAPNVHSACNSLYPVLNFWVANIYHGLNVTHWGFNTMQMGKVANDFVSFTNYRDVGFSMDNGH